MTRRFVLLTKGFTSDNQRAFVSALGVDTGWWQQIPGGWLIVDHNDMFTVESIRDIYEGVNPMAECLIAQVEPETWASRLVDPDGLKQKWLRDHWSKN